MRIFLVGNYVPEPESKFRIERTLEFLDANVATGGDAPGQGAISVIDRQELEFEELEGGKRRLEISKMSVEMSVEAGASPVVEVLQSPLEGKKLLAEKTDDVWSFELEGEDPSEEESAALKRFAEAENLSNDRFPSDEIELNQTWKAGWESLRTILGSQFQPTAGEATFRLARLTRFDGHRCADIEADIELTGTFADQDPPAEVELKLQGNILRSLNAYTDVKTDLEGTLTLKGQHPSGADIEITAPAKLKHAMLRVEEE
ncbi:MAG: hypothetical protein AAGA58_01010 [Verrucomicrobiota bacterium]